MVGFESNSSLHFELNGLHDQLKEKDRELRVASTEIKALRATNVLKDKASEELRKALDKSDEKLAITEKFLEQKNLEITKLANEKKDAVAAQFAAEAALRRLHSNQKENDSFHFEPIMAPLEANLKIYKNEIAALQADKKALERISKSKESALVEAEKILTSALERALIVEEVQNHNFELKRQIEIYQEENRIIDKRNRQKALEVEKLSKTVIELEESILAGGAVTNMVHDYKRQILELHEEKRTLERELARVKVSANRVATVVANEWKNENDKVIPIKQWLDERRLLQVEMQRLRDKLVVSKRTAKAEAQLKDKFKLSLKTLEEGFKLVSSVASANSNASYMSPETEKGNQVLGFLSNTSMPKKRCSSQPRGSRSSPLQWPNTYHETRKMAAELKLVRKNLWASKSPVKENTEMKINTDLNISKFRDHDDDKAVQENVGANVSLNDEVEVEKESVGNSRCEEEDVVSGYLYDRLQREVVNLMKSCEAKESSLIAKDEEIKSLMKKVDTLTKSMEVESRRVKRETTVGEKEELQVTVSDMKKIRNRPFPKWSVYFSCYKSRRFNVSC